MHKREKKVVFDKNDGTISNHVITKDQDNQVVDTTNSQPQQDK